MAKLVIGCGYLGRRVALAWLGGGETVYALTRSPVRARSLEALGLKPLVGDVARPAELPACPAVDTILHAVGFDRLGGHDKRTVYVDGLANVLAWTAASAAAPHARLIHIGSSSVYGQTSGEAVDEDSPCEPATESGRICLAAERVLTEHPAWGPRAIRLRLTGIYGPGRVPRRDAILRGEPIATVADGTLNLIHVDDAVAAVRAVEVCTPPQLFCVSDDRPLERRAYYEAIAKHLGAPPVTIVPPPPDAPVAERAQADKQVRNLKLRNVLGWVPQYPDCLAGLAAIFREEDSAACRGA